MLPSTRVEAEEQRLKVTLGSLAWALSQKGKGGGRGETGRREGEKCSGFALFYNLGHIILFPCFLELKIRKLCFVTVGEEFVEVNGVLYEVFLCW